MWLRRSAFVVLGAGAYKDPSKQLGTLLLFPYPTKSAMVISDGHAPLNTVVLLTSATLPAVALIEMVPVLTSGVGSGLPFAPLELA